jgi:hypothetical protein
MFLKNCRCAHRGAGGGGALAGHYWSHAENVLTGWHAIGPQGMGEDRFNYDAFDMVKEYSRSALPTDRRVNVPSMCPQCA